MGRKLVEEEEEECLSDVETLEVAEKKKKSKKKKKNNNNKKESEHGEFVEEEEEEEEENGTVGLTNGRDREADKLKRKKEKAEKHEEGGVDDDEKVDGSEINGSDSKKKKKIKKKEKEKNKRKRTDSSEEFEGNAVLEVLGSNGIDSKKKKKKERVNQGEENRSSIVQEEVKGVIVSGNNTEGSKYKVVSSFDELNLPDEVLHCCKSFSKPSPIQSHAWPFLLDGRDLIGIAATGSGKTLAFGIPALMHVLLKEKKKKIKRVNPLCLVLSPTRELAQQIADVLCEAGETCGVRSVCLYGGAPKGPQISALKSGVDIVIGTPGRMKDLIEMGVCCLQEVSFVVLDEADRMLDLGFEPEVRAIVTRTCNTRQMVMFSATWPPSVDKLAKAFMNSDPVKVIVGSEDLTANHDVMQIVEVIEDRSRDARLVALLEKYHRSQRNRVLVFVLYKKEASRVENMLIKRGWKAVSVHGDKCQSERTKALASFKDGTCPLMVATDVAARGLDIPDVEVVINYSFPLVTEDYVHRIGRTGRAGKKGVSHTFFMQENKALAGELVNVLREAGQIVPDALLKFGTHVKKKESKLYGAHFKEIKGDAPKSTKITFDSDNDD